MAETFQDLKVKLIEHYRRVQSADELTAGFNLLVDGDRRIEKDFSERACSR